MKKTVTLFFVAASFGTMAQSLVGTSPTNKVAVVEEFTGVNCPNCPGGHTAAASILASNPGQVVLMAYHPSNSSYTTPNAGEPDFRRSYLDNFYSNAYIGSRYMPSALISRRTWGAEKNTGAGAWAGHVQTIIAETSPVNVGVSSVYNATTDELTVTVEVYYTSDVTNPNSIYVHLTEDDIVAAQSGSGGSPTYVHSHMFREHISTGIWGDAITGGTTAGSLFTDTYVFDMSGAISPVDMSKAHVTAFVYDSAIEENYSAATGSVAVSAASIDAITSFASIKMYPNPSTGLTVVSVESTEAQDVTVNVIDGVGKIVSTVQQHIGTGENFITLNENSTLKAGIYFVNVNNGVSTKSVKLVIQ
jgi:hypothetical protein